VRKLSTLVSDGLNVHVGCHKPGCKRIRVMSAKELLERLGDLTLDELKARLRCKCGERPVDVIPRRDTSSSAIRN
jgi:hypothetical protein